MNTPGCIELTWNYGSENEEGMVYNTGNADDTGTADGNKIRGGELVHCVLWIWFDFIVFKYQYCNMI